MEDSFIRNQAPGLAFNWELVAELLNATSAFAGPKRSAQECSGRWSVVSNPTAEASKDSTDPSKESPSAPRFHILEQALGQSYLKREMPFIQDDPQTPPDPPCEEKYLSVLELIQAKTEEEEAHRRTLQPKPEANPLVPPTQVSRAEEAFSPLPRPPVLQAPIALPRLAPAPGHPPMLLARPNMFHSLQSLGLMRNGMGSILSMPRPPQEQMGSTAMQPGIRPFSPSGNMGSFAASANNGRMMFPITSLRPGAPMPNVDLNTPEGRANVAQINAHREFLVQRMLQLHQTGLRNNPEGLQSALHLNNSHQMLEQQRQILRHIHENGGVYPMASAPQMQGQQIRPRLPANGNPFPNAQVSSAMSPQAPQPTPGPSTPYLQPAPETPKPAKPRARAPKKAPARKRAQKPPVSEPTPQPRVSSAVATPSPHAPSPHPLQFMTYSSTPTQQPPAQVRYPMAPNMPTQHLNMSTHMMMPLPHFQHRTLLPQNQPVHFMPPQLGPTSPARPVTSTPQHLPPPTSAGQAPDCRQD